MSTNAAGPRGIRASVRRVVRHVSALVMLERELAELEMKRKAGSFGAGAGLGTAAAVVAVYALGAGIATVAAALAIVLDLWLALLIVFVALALIAVILALVARKLLKQATPPVPEEALAEARATKEVLRSRGS